MVGFVSKPAIEADLAEPSKLCNSINPETTDPSPADSFFSFDFIEDWFKDKHPTNKTELDSNFNFGGFEMAEENENPVELCGDGVKISELIDDGFSAELKVEAEESKKNGDLENVDLAAQCGICDVTDDTEGNKAVSGSEASSSSRESSSESDDESESSSSSSSGSEESDSDDGEEVKIEANVDAEVEEGEILEIDGRQMVSGEDGVEDEDEDEDDVDNMVTWSDDDEGGGMAKPIRSKNELADLPPVPPVDVSLQPNHQMLPVGVVLSVIGAKVIVEGVEKHTPLSEGSILWITEKRSPLGLVDEIFGPVKNPYYVIRYNSESEVPAGIQDGSTISFVPEFANHVLDDKSLYKKGYDASGDNDEEVTDEAEFSDDEKEAEYKRMQKSSKRVLNENNKQKGTNRDREWKNNKPSGQQPNADKSQLSIPSSDHGNNPAFNVGQGGMQYEQPQGTVFPGGFPAQAMPWLLQTLLQNPYQMAMPMPFQQQFDPSQRPVSCPPGGQQGFFPGSAFPPWGGFMGQNNFNQAPFGNAGQGTAPNGTRMEQNGNLQPPNAVSGNSEAPGEFNHGASYGRGRGRGRKQYGRGGGRFERGRGGGRGREPNSR